jgi:hypothetical protein
MKVRSKKPGAALVLVMSGLVLLLGIGTGLLSLGLYSRMTTARTSHEIGARCAADAGLTNAVFAMNQKLIAGSWSDSIESSIKDFTLPSCDATYSYDVVAKDIGSNTEFNVACIGRSGHVTRQVNATARLKGLFESAILTKGPMILKSDTLVSGYNSLDPTDTDVQVAIGTTSILPDQIVLNNNVTVDGDVLVGVDGSPGSVIKDLGATTGGRYSMGDEPPFPQITPPVLPDMATNIYVKGETLTITPTDSGKYTGIELAQKSEKVKGNSYIYPAVLEINGGDIILHIAGNIEAGESCEIVINEGSSLRIYVDGDVHCGANGGFRNKGTPNSKSFQMHTTGNGAQTLDLKAKGHWCGSIYAPNGDVDIYAEGDIYGAIVADSFEFKAGGAFYYDEALREVGIDDEGVRFVISQWAE